MQRVTLLLTGVPQFVTLRDLSYNLDLLFNTDEIETFKIRDLPNHPQTNNRQIALDFRSGYDAMAAQEKLEGYTYELDNGREYTLHAKINKSEEYKSSESPEYGGSHWYGDDWTSLDMIPNVFNGDMYRAHARLDAQLGLLKKQKLVLEKEKELLYERQRLKRKYGTMARSLYENPSTSQAQHDQLIERPLQLTCDSETELSPPKRSRSTSQDYSGSKHPRSSSREIRPLRSHRSRSKDSGYILPEIEWYDDRTKTRELISHFGEHSRSHGYSRDRRSSSRELRDHRYPVSRHTEPTSRSNEKHRYKKSPSEERGIRARSRSQDWTVHSREPRSRGRWSHSREHKYFRRSMSQDRILIRKSRSRDRAHHNDARVPRSNWDYGDRKLRSPDKRTNQLAIMPRNPQRSPSEWSVDSSKAVTPTHTKHKVNVKKKVRVKVEKHAKLPTKRETKENKTDNTEKIKDKERKKVQQYNSKIKKAARFASRIQALSKDVMILVAIVVDEIMDRDKIRISASNKVALIKILEALVNERLEPLARVIKNDDNKVLKKYKMQYPMKYDLKMIKQMLDEIPKLEIRESKATVTGSSGSDKTDNKTVVDVKVLDVENKSTGQQCNTKNFTPLDIISVKRIENEPQIKTEPKDEPILIIDSAERPVPRHPQFFIVIKSLVKNMNKVITANKLDGEIRFAELKYVLRHILRNMLKGHGYLPREEIMRKFREIYPMENDEQFVRNTIKDISDGKYPGLTGQVGDTPESDDDIDDVVMVEKKYDVVTVTDSDDDDDVKKKPTIEVINLDCELTLDNLSQANPSRAIPGPSNDLVMSGPVNLDQGTSANSDQDRPRFTNVVQANTDLAKPGRAKTDPIQPSQAMKGPTNTSQTTKTSDNLGQANIDAANVNQTNIGHTNTGPIVEYANPGQAKIGTAPVRDLGRPGQVNTGLAYPIQGQTGLVNLGQANTGLAKHSQAKKASANPRQDKPGPANASQVKTGLGNPGQAKICVPNCSQAKAGLANFSQTMPGPANASQAKKGPNNLGQANTFNTHQTKKGPGNPGQTKTVSVNPSQSKIGPGNPGQAKPGPVNAAQAKKGPNNSQQAKKGPVKISQTKSGPISGQAAPNNTLSMKENQKRASLDSTIQNLESLNNASNVNVVVISPPSVKVGGDRKKRRRRRKHAGKLVDSTYVSCHLDTDIQETPGSSKINQSNEDSKDKVNRNTNNDENDNNLKVTAITIVTSLNELIAKSTAQEPEKYILTDEIKKEIEEEAELDDSSLNLDSDPRVTSITIMTSDAELFSLVNKDRKEVNEIKNEPNVYYGAEDNLVNDIEIAFDDVNFGNIRSGNIEHNSVNSKQCRSVNNTEQFSKRHCVPLGSRTVQDDEESIEL